MIVVDEQEKRQALLDLLYELALNQDALKEKSDRVEYFKKLENIYYKAEDNNFRHFYSDIYSCLTVIDGDPERGNINILAQNMEIIKEGYRSNVNKDANGKPIDISKEIVKLYDHINLDIGRLNYTHRITENTTAELSKTKLLIEQLQEQMEDAKRKTERFSSDFETKANVLSDEIKEGQKKMQNEYITILGIFAAIVLAFTGGMTFTSSVLENIHKSSIYRIAFITLIIGCILFNLIWLLIDFIRNMNEKAIKKKWMFWTFNLMFICLMIFTFVAYKYNWMAKEEIINQRFQDEQQVEEQK
ncbi:MAG: hypothetical protein ACLS4P_08070 [Dorea sp.]